jgi:putative membrane protein
MKERTAVVTIVLVSVLIPALVATLFYSDFFALNLDADLQFLPAFHASLNGATACILTVGYAFIRRRNAAWHKAMMLTATACSAVFLLSYVVYHSQSESTVFGGEGWLRSVYYFVLLSHILLAIAVVPLVLLTLFRSLTGQFQRHRKIAIWTFPVWLYVSVTGVVVYLLISPYY